MFENWIKVMALKGRKDINWKSGNNKVEYTFGKKSGEKYLQQFIRN